MKNPEPWAPSMPYTIRFPRPGLTADCVVFGIGGDTLNVLLIQQDGNPRGFMGHRAVLSEGEDSRSRRA